MAWDPISGTFIQYSEDDVDASGFYLKFYASGTVTPISMADDSTGGTLLAKCVLDSDGFVQNGSGAPFIPHIDQQYKIVIYRNATDADADTIANAYKEIDELYPLSTSGQTTTVYGTLSAAKSGSRANGETAITSGYFSAGDGGGAEYLVKTVAAYGGTPDGYGDHATDDGNFVLVLQETKPNFRQFGAVGDGTTDDALPLQAAFVYGVSLYPTKGEFITHSELSISSVLSIIGNSTDSNIVGHSSLIGKVINASAAISITGMGIDASALTSGSGGQGSAIWINGVDNCFIKGNRIKVGKSSGVSLNDSSHCIVANNSFPSSSVDPATLTTDWGEAVAVLNGSSYNNISNNTMKGQAQGVLVQEFTEFANPEYNVISGNVIEDSYAYGILCYTVHSSSHAGNNVISDNVIKRVRGSIYNLAATDYSFGAGIYIQGVEGCTITGNFISDTNEQTNSETLAPAGIGVTNTKEVTITGNTIQDVTYYGVALFDPSVEGAANDGAVVSGNTINNTGKAGIKVKDRGDFVINGNSISDTSDQGIRIHSTSATIYENGGISSNLIKGTGAIGINIEEMKDMQVSANTVDTCVGSGITTDDLSSKISITNNTIKNVTSRGIDFRAITGLVMNNQLADCVTGIQLFGAAIVSAKCKYNIIDGSTTGISNSSHTGNIDSADNVFISCTTDHSGDRAEWTDLGSSGTPASYGRRSVGVAAGTNVTWITGGQYGDEITLFAGAARTIVHGTAGSNIILNGSVNYVMAATDVLTLKLRDNDRWYETGRSA